MTETTTRRRRRWWIPVIIAAVILVLITGIVGAIAASHGPARSEPAGTIATAEVGGREIVLPQHCRLGLPW